MAVTATIAVGVHSTKGSNITGVCILACMLLAAAVYLVKPYWFELFYYVHIACYLAILPLVLLHFSARYFAYAAGFWVLDLMLRYVLTRHKVVMSASLLPGGLIRLRYKKVSSYKAGQYVFLMVPALSRVEFHPFSYSSAPGEEYVTIHVRQVGDWTRRLGAYVRRRQVELRAAGAGKEGWVGEGGVEERVEEGVEVEVVVEGPFGAMQIDMDSPQYEVHTVPVCLH
jgi:NADPH oxidase